MTKTKTTIRSLPTRALRLEIKRREREVAKLDAGIERARAFITDATTRINELGGRPKADDKTPRKKKEGELLIDVLLRATRKGKRYTVKELATLALEHGYETTSRAFRTVVNQCVVDWDGDFERVSRGVYKRL